MLVYISVCGFIYYYILPSGRVSQTAKAVFSLISLAAVCVPLFYISGDGKDMFFSFNADENTEIYEPYSIYEDIAKDTVEEKISLVIKNYTDLPFFIETVVNITDDGCINIEQVSVKFEKYPDSLPEIRNEIESKTGISPVFGLKEKSDD